MNIPYSILLTRPTLLTFIKSWHRVGCQEKNERVTSGDRNVPPTSRPCLLNAHPNLGLLVPCRGEDSWCAGKKSQAQARATYQAMLKWFVHAMNFNIVKWPWLSSWNNWWFLWDNTHKPYMGWLSTNRTGKGPWLYTIRIYIYIKIWSGFPQSWRFRCCLCSPALSGLGHSH